MQMISYAHEGLLLLLKELGVQLSKPIMNLLAWLILSLLEKTAAHLVRLAEKLPDDDTTDMARRQRVHRFLSNPRISPRLFVRVFVTLLRPLVQNASTLVLSMDRTDWVKRGQPVNVLNVAPFGRLSPFG